jgi:AmmeMemoRadiSam system protein A
MSETGLDIDQQRFLLKLAREALFLHLEGGKAPRIDVEEGVLKEKRGAFVTLKREEELRGCIGYPLPHDPLYLTVIEAAVMAATQDHRFPAVTLDELPDIRIEISVLTLPRKIDDISEVIIGEHGIIVTQGLSRGLLLPQVPVEWDWDRDTFLRHGCLKAGLEEDAWEKGAEIQVFSAQVFSE